MRAGLFTALFALVFFSVLGTRNAQAEPADARLVRIETRLDEISKKLDTLLEGQKKNEEEHTQMRYWIKRA